MTGATVTGSSAIPHFGQAPGPFCRTSIHGAGVLRSMSAGAMGPAERSARNASGAERNWSRQLWLQVVGLTLLDMPDGIVGRDGHSTDRVEDFGRCDGGMAVIVA